MKPRTKILIYICLLVTGLLLGSFFAGWLGIGIINPHTQARTSHVSKGERIYSLDKSISIFAPKAWTFDSNPQKKGVKLWVQSPYEYNGDPFQEIVYINEDALPYPIFSLDDYMDGFTVKLKNKLKNPVIEEESDAEVNGHAAKKLIISYTHLGVRAKAISYTIAINNIAYTIQGMTLDSAFEFWQAGIDQICLSVKFHQ